MKACAKCGEIRGYSEFTVWRKNASMTKNYYSKNCRPCARTEQRKVRAIKKLFPVPKAGTPCTCCGKVDRLFVDHDWSVDDPKISFRGYVCKSCNVGMGHLGDSLAGVQKAAKYLAAAEARSSGLKAFNTFALDFENSCLLTWSGEIPKGPQRLENKEWFSHMQEQCKDSELDFDEYCAWVKQGGGDVWFYTTEQLEAEFING